MNSGSAHGHAASLEGDNLYPQTLKADFGDKTYAFDVPAGVWNPTPHGIHLGNMLLKLDFTGEHVLELGSGCGIHTVLLAERGAKELTVTEIVQDALDNTKHNLDKFDVTIPVNYEIADWVQVSMKGSPYDTLVSNPPFAKSGKRYRRYFYDTMIHEAHKLVKPGGRMIFINSSMADISRSIKLMQEWDMSVRIVGETSGPFRPYYFEDERYMLEMAAIPGAYTLIDGVHHERLIVYEATLPA